MVIGWPPDKTAKLIELVNKGKTDGQISVIIGKSRSAVTHKRRRMGLESPVKQDHNALNRPWSDDDKKRLLEMYAEKASLELMALEFNRTTNGVNKQLMRMDVVRAKSRNRLDVLAERVKNKEMCRRELLLLCRHHPEMARQVLRERQNELG